MTTPETAQDKIGQTLAGKFKLTRLIGSGGMGAVFEGVHTWTERVVAVKILFDDAARHKDMVERFFREARAATKIGHAHIVDVLDMGQDTDGSFFIVQEFVQGETLRDYLTRLTRLAPRDALEIMLPVMDALIAAHSHGITHRDIKPENIMIHALPKGGRQPKVIDFGIAKFDEGRKMTARGEILGTPSYMSPEQARGEPTVSAQADVWAVGVVLYECLCGTRPFEGRSLTDLLAKIVLEPPKPLLELAPGIPSDLAEIVMRALKSDRLERWGSIKAMFNAIVQGSSLNAEPWMHPWRAHEPGYTPRPSPAPPAPQDHQQRPLGTAVGQAPTMAAQLSSSGQTIAATDSVTARGFALSSKVRAELPKWAAPTGLFLAAAIVAAYTLSPQRNASNIPAANQVTQSTARTDNAMHVGPVPVVAANSQGNRASLTLVVRTDAGFAAESPPIHTATIQPSGPSRIEPHDLHQLPANPSLRVLSDAGVPSLRATRNPSRNPVRTPAIRRPHIETPPEQIID